MSTPSRPPPSDAFPRGSITLALTFLFVLLFRLEQNAAYALGLPSPRPLLETDRFLPELLVHTLAPFLHATPDHLLGTLVLFVPFGYLLERRTSPAAYVGFVVLAGYVTTTFVPLLFLGGGVSVGQGFGASGVTSALVAREATTRVGWQLRRRALSRRQQLVVLLVILSLLVEVAGLLLGEPPETSVVGHATGLVLGALAAVAERTDPKTDE